MPSFHVTEANSVISFASLPRLKSGKCCFNLLKTKMGWACIEDKLVTAETLGHNVKQSYAVLNNE